MTTSSNLVCSYWLSKKFFLTAENAKQTQSNKSQLLVNKAFAITANNLCDLCG